MGRAITPAVEAALLAPHVDHCTFVELQFPSGTLRLTDAAHSMYWDSYEWLAGGRVAKVGQVSEVADVQAAALEIAFSGIDPAYMSAVLADHYQGRVGRVWIAILDPATMTVIPDPIPAFVGTMDEPVVTLGRSAEIVLTLENRFADWDRPRPLMQTDAHHQSRFPGDTFFADAAAMESVSLTWGTYRGPVAPDPGEIFNRSLDRLVSYKVKGIPLVPGVKQTLDLARNVGDRIAKVFGF